MKVIIPDYYPDFHCIADRCRHSCCIGWEIDVDPDTREKYRCIPGEFGARLSAAIDDSGDTAHFRLGPNERCPMLNASGLCDLITRASAASSAIARSWALACAARRPRGWCSPGRSRWR